MALVNDEWIIKLNVEMENIETYTSLVGIIQSMMTEECYTIDSCFADLVALAERVRSHIDERKFPLKGLQLDGEDSEPLALVKNVE